MDSTTIGVSIPCDLPRPSPPILSHGFLESTRHGLDLDVSARLFGSSSRAKNMETDPTFLPEIWALYGIGTAVILTRFAVRGKTVGWRNFRSDDFFSLLTLILFTVNAVLSADIYTYGTNLDTFSIPDGHFPPGYIDQFEFGSKLQLALWYCYTLLIWTLKGTMLCFFGHLTRNRNHIRLLNGLKIFTAIAYLPVLFAISFGCWPIYKNWQIDPDPGYSCTLEIQNLIVTTVCNVSTDALILCVPVVLLWKLQVPSHKKIVIGLFLSSGLFIIAAAVVRIALTLDGTPSTNTVNRWGFAESFVGILAVSIPILRPVLNRRFWKWGSTGDSGGSGGPQAVERRRRRRRRRWETPPKIIRKIKPGRLGYGTWELAPAPDSEGTGTTGASWQSVGTTEGSSSWGRSRRSTLPGLGPGGFDSAGGPNAPPRSRMRSWQPWGGNAVVVPEMTQAAPRPQDEEAGVPQRPANIMVRKSVRIMSEHPTEEDLALEEDEDVVWPGNSVGQTRSEATACGYDDMV